MSITGFYCPTWLQGLPDLKEKLRRGESIVVGGSVYRVCPQCLQVVKLNKSFFGSAHFCTGE